MNRKYQKQILFHHRVRTFLKGVCITFPSSLAAGNAFSHSANKHPLWRQKYYRSAMRWGGTLVRKQLWERGGLLSPPILYVYLYLYTYRIVLYLNTYVFTFPWYCKFLMSLPLQLLIGIPRPLALCLPSISIRCFVKILLLVSKHYVIYRAI